MALEKRADTLYVFLYCFSFSLSNGQENYPNKNRIAPLSILNGVSKTCILFKRNINYEIHGGKVATHKKARCRNQNRSFCLFTFTKRKIYIRKNERCF